MKTRYQVGLEKLLAAEADVTVMKTELIELQPKLVETGKEVEETLKVGGREGGGARRWRRRSRCVWGEGWAGMG